MKGSSSSWRDYLQDGIHLMEGTHPDPARFGRRWFREANAVFEECASESTEASVRVEAHFRRGQCAAYLGDFSRAVQCLSQGREALHGTELSGEDRAQCYILEAVILRAEGRYGEAYDAAWSAWVSYPKSRKLLGDIANVLGCLCTEYGRGIGKPPPWNFHQGAQAADWLTQACHHLERIPDPCPLVLHALAVVNGRTAITFQMLEGYRSARAFERFRRAEALFSTSVREPCVRAAYWVNRARVAFRCLRLPQAVWFFLRSCAPAIACWRQKCGS